MGGRVRPPCCRDPAAVWNVHAQHLMMTVAAGPQAAARPRGATIPLPQAAGLIPLNPGMMVSCGFPGAGLRRGGLEPTTLLRGREASGQGKELRFLTACNMEGVSFLLDRSDHPSVIHRKGKRIKVDGHLWFEGLYREQQPEAGS